MEKVCVSTIVGGTPEIVVEGETGFLCPPRDVEGLAEAMKKLCAAGPEECTKMGKAGREYILGKMDKATQFDAYLNFFTSLKGERAKHIWSRCSDLARAPSSARLLTFLR